MARQTAGRLSPGRQKVKFPRAVPNTLFALSEIEPRSQQAAANLAALIESTDDLIWSVDLNFGILTFNRALQDHVKRNFGTQVSLGKRPEDLLPPDRAALWPPLFRRALSDGPFRIEVPFPDGRILEMSFNTIVIDGKTTGVSIFGKDIAERRAAKEARASLATLIETSQDAIIANNLNGEIVGWNPGAQRLLGYRSEEILGRQLSILIIPSHLENMRENLKTLGESRAIQSFDGVLVHKDGHQIDVSISISAICDAEGRVVGTAGISRDITARKQAEMKLRESEERYRKVFHTSLDPIVIHRAADLRLIDANQAFLDLVGAKRDEVIGRSWLELNLWADPRDREILLAIFDRDSECRNVEVALRNKSEQTLWVLLSAVMIEIDGESCWLSIARDISTARAAQAEIRNLAFYDSLTELPNRRLLLERLNQSLSLSTRPGRMCALVLVDLDSFKTVNDTLGHPAGDLLLQEAARRIVACVRDSDTVARLGGDEFVLMLEDLRGWPEGAAAQAKQVGEKILAALAQSYLLNGRRCRSTASIGVAVFGDRQETASELLQQADIAMYQAKAAGRNTLRFFAPALQAAVTARAALEDDLRQAIKTSQFVLYFQPQIDRNRLVGAEALVRWNHPLRKILQPAEG